MSGVITAPPIAPVANFAIFLLQKGMSNRNTRQQSLNENDQLLGRNNGQHPGRIQRRNQGFFNRMDMNRRNLLMAVLSNVDMETGDERRNSMNREVFRHAIAALNAIDRFEGSKFYHTILRVRI